MCVVSYAGARVRTGGVGDPSGEYSEEARESAAWSALARRFQYYFNVAQRRSPFALHKRACATLSDVATTAVAARGQRPETSRRDGRVYAPRVSSMSVPRIVMIGTPRAHMLHENNRARA